MDQYPQPYRRCRCVHLTIILLVVASSACLARAGAQEPSPPEQLLRSGHYERCIEMVQQAVQRGEAQESWRLAQLEAELTLGRYLDAATTLEQSLRRNYSSIPLRYLGFRTYRHLGDTQRAQQMLAEIDALVRRSPWSYRGAASRVALGRFFADQGADARRVLELFYDRVKKDQPDYVDAYLAAGELALDKHDYEIAATEFQQALKIAPQHPDAHYGLARAFAPSDSARADEALSAVLRHNPRHIPSLLLVADREIDGEKYRAAETTLDKVLAINPEQIEAWAARAVIAHLESRPEDEALYRRVALGWWPLNPRVDYLIGRELSQHYRFQEGATYQRRALAMDAGFLDAQVQLSNDLLRLGDDDGWQLAAQVAQADQYNVVAHNLMQLQQRLDSFVTLERPPFLLRMDAREAEIYGTEVLDLLEKAHAALAPKYQVQFDQLVLIEIFPDQQDFAIRTFGLPGGEGFLGVCFGRLITANSPAALGANSTNWQSVLWHEFCHVLTLSKTTNKMPRWFSEGISVYEERLANPAWGEQLTPTYREMILTDQLTPLSQLSSAFLRPPSPLHLQFAYYEASLVIEYIVEQHGFDTVLRILDDLALGMAMNESLAQRVGELSVLDEQFASFARQRAEAYAPGLDWTKPEAASLQDLSAVTQWLTQHPRNFYGLREQSRLMLEQKNWEAARDVAQQLRTLCPQDIGPDNAYLLLAAAHQGMNDTQAEAAVLEELAQRDADAGDVYMRLCQLAQQSEKWDMLQQNAERALAVNPLRPAVQQARADAAEKLGQSSQAIAAYRALLALDPLDPVRVHYALANALHAAGQSADARFHLLRALEEAPRFRAAHRLLLDVHRSTDSTLPSATPPAAAAP